MATQQTMQKMLHLGFVFSAPSAAELGSGTGDVTEHKKWNFGTLGTRLVSN